MVTTIRRWLVRAALTLAVFVPAGIALLVAGVQVSSQPRFCGSCHVMEPYYDSWKTSSHSHVACVECHIPPGISSEIRKKYEALAMVTSYFTGTYGTNPWAEVDDRSCLRSGCHETRLLLGRELFGEILFDHQPHLTELRKEKRLRCTSCHSQIVQGSHISVTPTTCFLCHFKDTPANHGTARCEVCHEVPSKMITVAGLEFDHGDVKRFGMECMLCHEGVVRGAGEVPAERCMTCHNDPPRLARYGETEFLHRTHVTDHKVECLNCHIEITHGVPPREQALATECATCHTQAAGHSAVRDLYRGIGGKAVSPRPAAMYLAGIRCEACHDVPSGEHRGANEVSCMACHGPKSFAVYQSWKKGLDERIAGVRTELTEARARKAADTGGLLARAEENLVLVERGKGMHNPRYARDLLEQAHRDVGEAMKSAGASAPSSPPWREAAYESECLDCHFGVEYTSPPAFGREFPHMSHVVSAGLRCTICHEAKRRDGERPRHGELKLAADGCDSCHERVRQKMTVGSEECLACHVADIGATSGSVRFPHERHVATGLDCGLCHAGVANAPHREFARSPEALPKAGHPFCGTCHAGDVLSAEGVPPEGANCAKCHAT